MLKIVKKTLIEHIPEYEVVAVPMSINNSMSSGLRYEIALNFPLVKEEEKKTPYGDRRKYGKVHEIVYENTIFCMCYMYRTKYKKQSDPDSVDYEALKSCLEQIKKKYGNKKIAMPVLGCSEYDGHGHKSKILQIIQDVLHDTHTDVYDYEQRDYGAEMFREIAALHKKLKDRKIDGKEYIRLRSEVEWRRRYGIFKPMREGYTYIPRRGEIKKKE